MSKYGAGVCFKPEDEKDFLNKLNVLKKNQELYHQLQRGCANLAKDFDRKKLADDMLGILQDVAAQRIEPAVAPTETQVAEAGVEPALASAETLERATAITRNRRADRLAGMKTSKRVAKP